MTRAVLPTLSDEAMKTIPITLETLQKYVEDLEARVRAMDGGSQFAAASAGVAVASAPVVLSSAKEITGMLFPRIARTATVAGATTGLIADGGGALQVILVSATDAAHIIKLPTPVLGTIIVLIEVTTAGYNLQASAQASIGINGGTGAAVKSAIPASTTVILVCETLTNWKGLQLSSTAGTLAKVAAAS